MLTNRKLLTTVCALLALPATSLLADSLQLTGVVRDFKRGDRTGGHPDFETCHTVSGHGDYGLVYGLVTMDLGTDGKPVYNPTRPSNDSIWSAASLAQWFKDVSNVNVSFPVTLTLSNGQSAAGGTYSYANTKFFPIDTTGYGNEGCKDASGNYHNFGFTFELHNSFSYRPGQKFTFIGDDDVWVYVNAKRVIDLGGVHSAQTGSVLLFNGKAFPAKAAFPIGGSVKQVTTSMASTLASQWSTLGMSGSCPIAAGDPYIDLALNTTDAALTFTSTSVAVKAVANMSSVTLKFTDNTVQTITGLTAATGTFSGTGAYRGKQIAGLWIKFAGSTGTTYGDYYGSDGAGGAGCTLDFFFAERHTTESNFRIDTSITLKPKQIATISPLYD